MGIIVRNMSNFSNVRLGGETESIVRQFIEKDSTYSLSEDKTIVTSGNGQYSVVRTTIDVTEREVYQDVKKLTSGVIMLGLFEDSSALTAGLSTSHDVGGVANALRNSGVTNFVTFLSSSSRAFYTTSNTTHTYISQTAMGDAHITYGILANPNNGQITLYVNGDEHLTSNIDCRPIRDRIVSNGNRMVIGVGTYSYNVSFKLIT